jgi:hypothetical protein
VGLFGASVVLSDLRAQSDLHEFVQPGEGTEGNWAGAHTDNVAGDLDGGENESPGKAPPALGWWGGFVRPLPSAYCPPLSVLPAHTWRPPGILVAITSAQRPLEARVQV